MSPRIRFTSKIPAVADALGSELTQRIGFILVPIPLLLGPTTLLEPSTLLEGA